MPIPKAPKPGPTPRPPRLKPPGTLRLSAPTRNTESIKLDNKVTVPFVDWHTFRKETKFRPGEMITIVGTTGSGKTVLMRELVKNRRFCALLGTKNRDKELYGPYEKAGFEVVDVFDPSPEANESRVIFRPRLTSPDRAGLKKQGERFGSMLHEVWEYGGWTVAIDELYYLSNQLGQEEVLRTLWTQGRSDGISVVGCTQEPVSIPVMAFSAATHLFLFRNSDQRRIKRMSEFAGADERTLRELIPLLPKHEFVYVDTREGTLLRSKVILSADSN